MTTPVWAVYAADADGGVPGAMADGMWSRIREAVVGDGKPRVSGHIAANAVEVKGTLSGTVECHSLTLRATAVVTADVTYALLVIENGAQIEGRMVKIKA